MAPTASDQLASESKSSVFDLIVKNKLGNNCDKSKNSDNSEKDKKKNFNKFFQLSLDIHHF